MHGDVPKLCKRYFIKNNLPSEERATPMQERREPLNPCVAYAIGHVEHVKFEDLGFFNPPQYQKMLCVCVRVCMHVCVMLYFTFFSFSFLNIGLLIHISVKLYLSY